MECKPREYKPSRRLLLTAIGAAAAARAVTPRIATASEESAGLPYHGAGELRRALATRKISSRELVDASIARIEALDPKFNAVVVRDFDRARVAAKAADAALARGERRPLLGLPMTVKEQFNVAGLPTSWGDPEFKDWHPTDDALAVQRLKAAGAIVLGKTNIPLNISDWQSYNEVYGTTNNPFDVSRTPGGSSGGGAAALAAGFVPLELGSDIAGSLRCPAHFCGIFAHKPSLELLPQRGSGPPRTPALPVHGDLGVIGPMSRSAADLALELDVVAGPDDLWDGVGYRLALPPPRHDRLADYRVLVVDKHPLCPTDAGVTGALNDFADHLVQFGCQVVRDSAKLPDLALTTRIYAQLLGAFRSVSLAPDERGQFDAAAEALTADDQSIAATFIRGVTIGYPEYVRANRIRNGLRARWQAFFQEIDVVVCPPMPTVAFPHDHTPFLNRHLDIDGKKIPYGDQRAWISIATVIGLPATVAPIGRSKEGLPIGVQIIGGYLQDRTTIAFAGLTEREFGGFTPPAI